jgi:hypothetical protein
LTIVCCYDLLAFAILPSCSYFPTVAADGQTGRELAAQLVKELHARISVLSIEIRVVLFAAMN